MPPAAFSLENDSRIREVWAKNLEQEMAIIREVIVHYPYLAMDTEFPGVVARPVGNFRSMAELTYQTVRCNVDLLKIIQLGITFADERGNLPDKICTWQFNFKFSLAEDMYAQDSIDLLTRSGIDFHKFEQDGVDVNHFAELLIPSGIVLTEKIKWITFHSIYDFAYLLKILTCQNLPTEESEFFSLLSTYFPCVYDIKYLMQSCKGLKGGLQDIADALKVPRIGPQHQAGSDSMMTCQTFFRLTELYFEDNIDDSKYMGHLYGVGTSYINKIDGGNAGYSGPIPSPYGGANGNSVPSSPSTTVLSNNVVNGGKR